MSAADPECPDTPGTGIRRLNLLFGGLMARTRPRHHRHRPPERLGGTHAATDGVSIMDDESFSLTPSAAWAQPDETRLPIVAATTTH